MKTSTANGRKRAKCVRKTGDSPVSLRSIGTVPNFPDAPEFFRDDQGPIERLSWGRFVIRGKEHGDSPAGQLGKGKDIRIIGEKVTRWKQRKGHRLKKSMITKVYDESLDVLIIGTGIEGAIEVTEKVRRAVEKHGVSKLIVAATPDACRAFNELHRKGKRVALLAHGTC